MNFGVGRRVDVTIGAAFARTAARSFGNEPSVGA